MLKNTRIQAVVVMAVGMVLGYAAATGRLQRLYADDRASPAHEDTGGSSVLPRPEAPFRGYIGRTAKDSIKEFPQEVQAPKGAPNVLLILTDDVGFGASSTFGGPIATPTFDRLAKDGLRYTQFHTCALCSPTRAALLSGRNHHSANTGIIMEGGHWIPGLQLAHVKELRDIRRSAQAKRLQHGVVWKEPQRSRLAQQPGWPLRPVANRAGL